MQESEEAIYKILGKTELENPGVDQNSLRTILEEVLYQYDINTKCTDLALINDIRDKLVMYLSVKRLDGLSEKTLYNYKLHLLRFADHMNKDITDINVMDIRVYLANYLKESNVKSTTLCNEISILKSFFGWLVDNDYLNKSPMNQIKQPKTEKRLRKSLSQEELERLRDACKTTRQKALLEFMFSTGCRLSEIVNVNISDLNWAERSLKVIGKGNKERIVYFSEKSRLASIQRRQMGLDSFQSV
jgi:integrase/recombinase XerD